MKNLNQINITNFSYLWRLLVVSGTAVIGIPKEKLDHIFDEFSQADESTTKKYDGTGLGLAISRRFCQMMGGDLSVTSSMGTGSTFSMHLPETVVKIDESESQE